MNALQSTELIAERSGIFKALFFGSQFHLLFKGFYHLALFARQKPTERHDDAVTIAGWSNFTRAHPQALPYFIVEARSFGVWFAGRKAKKSTQNFQHRFGVETRVWAKKLAQFFKTLRVVGSQHINVVLTHGRNFRILVLANNNTVPALAVFAEHVVFGLIFFDENRLQNNRLQYRIGFFPINIRDLVNHLLNRTS